MTDRNAMKLQGRDRARFLLSVRGMSNHISSERWFIVGRRAKQRRLVAREALERSAPRPRRVARLHEAQVGVVVLERGEV